MPTTTEETLILFRAIKNSAALTRKRRVNWETADCWKKPEKRKTAFNMKQQIPVSKKPIQQDKS
jgi:hypothetical protein